MSGGKNGLGSDDLSEYLRAKEPEKAELAGIWRAAIGLQKVDGLTPSAYLVETARRNIEGEITIAEAGKIIGEYYKSKAVRAEAAKTRTDEADIVSQRMTEVLAEPTFSFSPASYVSIHRKLFLGIYKHAGTIRDYNITKSEWVLKKDTVRYESAEVIAATLEYEFERERNFNYRGLSPQETISHFSRFIADVWQVHAFGEGNTRTTGIFAVKYLRTLGYAVENDIFADNSYYFRNALVRANYENPKLNVEKTQLPLEEFFKVLLFRHELELRNRYLRIGCEYGTKNSEAIGDLHRHDVGINVGITTPDVGINVGIKQTDVLTATEENCVKAILRNNRITAKELANDIGVTLRQAERLIASLKHKTNLRREGARKNGRWIFGE